mmetsp:Transcript_16012/g.27000  ORF Transcript_16012/g.27000 Transcript_16012/m.27000 type:complete len:125 (+) Transcript_16012:337-711(+)
MIVAGTSLTVSPANYLVTKVAATVPRLVVNMEAVGELLGIRYADVVHTGTTSPTSSTSTASTCTGSGSTSSRGGDALLQGECDVGFLALTLQLGWLDELYQYKERMCPVSAALLEHIYQTRQSS